MELTDRQSDQLETIQDTLAAHGYLPTPKKEERRRSGGRQEEEYGEEDQTEEGGGP